MLNPTSHCIRFAPVLSLLLFGGVFSGCTWVKPTPESEQVRIVPADRVADCERLGDLSTYTKAKVAGVNRKVAKVQEELETLAQVEAEEMGADTIVTTSAVSDGRQTYLAYRCQ